MRFTKMQGAGNDYIYVDCIEEPFSFDPRTICPKICDRHFGVGGDGLVLILPSNVADARMRMFNSDGSESEMCGNAIRCVAKFVFDRGICRRETLKIETGAGVLTLRCEVDGGRVSRVRVDMGEPILVPEKIPTTLRMDGDPNRPVLDAPLTVAGRTFPVCCVSMGNPHCVAFVDRIDDGWVWRVGPQVEVDPHFPRKVNAEFVEVLSRTELKMRVWERGTGETLACGTGACAVAVAAILSGRTEERLTVRLLGGDLEIERGDDGHIFMTGPAVEVFSGDYSC